MNFAFELNGIAYRCHTEVGDGPARVCLEVQPQAEPARSLDESGDDHEFA